MTERPADVPADYVHCTRCRPYCWHRPDYHERDPRIGTHWEGCWRSHHGCAIAAVERLQAALHKLAEDAEVAHQGGLHGEQFDGKDA